MGNRAVMTFNDNLKDVGVYVHWNGGPESVLAVLDACKRRGYSGHDYGVARFIGLWHELFANSPLSLGVGIAGHLHWDNVDNGCYVIDWFAWTITSRLAPEGSGVDTSIVSESQLNAQQLAKFKQIRQFFIDAERQAERKAA